MWEYGIDVYQGNDQRHGYMAWQSSVKVRLIQSPAKMSYQLNNGYVVGQRQTTDDLL